MARVIACRVLFDWDFNGTYTDESAHLVRCSGEVRFAPPENALVSSGGIVDRCSIELRNTAGRFSALNTSGALYAYIQSGGAYHVPVRVETQADGTNWRRVFTGVTQIPRETGRTFEGMPTVQCECRSRDELLRQRRTSTEHAEFRARVLTGETEAEIVQTILENEGLTSSDFAIDRGLVVIPWAWLDDESPLEEVWQLAAAAGGRLYTDVNGIYRYENMAHWLSAPHTTSQQTYTSADWQRFEAWYEDGELYNEVTVEYAAREPDQETVIWQQDEATTVPAGGTRTVTASYTHPAFTTPTLSWKAASAGGTDLTASVTVTPTWYAQRAVLLVSNSDTTRAAILQPFQIVAEPAVGGPSADVTRTSVDHGSNSAFFTSRGGRTRSIRGNVYIQSQAQAGMVAQFLLDRNERARLFYRLTGVPGDGLRQPGDRVTVNDPSVMSAARDVMVLAVNWRFAGGDRPAYVMDMECVDAAGLYPYATTSPGYFKVGGAGTGNQLGAAHANRGRLFY